MLFSVLFARFFERKKRSSSKSKTTHLVNSPEFNRKGSFFLNEKSSESTILTDHTPVSSTDNVKGPATNIPSGGQRPSAIYDGGFSDATLRGVCLRIANGGAGQTGLIKSWADAFIQEMVSKGAKPFQVGIFKYLVCIGASNDLKYL